MNAWLDRLNNLLHGLLALVGVGLLASSPWLALFDAIPPEAGWVDLAHVALGLASLPLVLLYVLACSHDGRWRLYFPWLAGDFGPLGRDLAGLARGERPMSEGGGLFAVIEGLLLLALFATALTGAAWFLLQGSDAVFAWWRYHHFAARSFSALLLLHIIAVALHLVDLIRS